MPRVSITCDNCGTSFERWPAHIRRQEARGYSGKFCSRACSDEGRLKIVNKGENHPAWKGGVDYRRRAFEAFGKVCIECGYSKEERLLWVHHKDFSRDNHSLENLVVLCIRCHLELHLERDRAIFVREAAKISLEI